MSQSKKLGVVLYRVTDLRTRDHEPLIRAHNENDEVIHLFTWDKEMSVSVDHGFKRFGKMESPRVPGAASDVPKIGFHRRRFLMESLKCLDTSLRREGDSKLHVVKGCAHRVILDALKECKDVQCSVYCHEGESIEECMDQRKLSSELSNVGVRLISSWGNTLIHRDDLPFDPETDLPTTFSTFRRLVEKREKRKSTNMKRDKVKIKGLSDQSPGHLVRKSLGLPKVWKSSSRVIANHLEDKTSYPPSLSPPSSSVQVSIFKGGEIEGRRRVNHYMLGTS